MAIERYYLGCGIWSKREWVGKLFSSQAKPEDYLREYASVFNAVEGNSTFYGLPTRETLQRWSSKTHEDFRFCFKFPRRISHQKRLVDADFETLQSIDLLSWLDVRLGPFFLQLPPSFGPSHLPSLDRFLENLPADHQYAVEVRHAGFNGEAAADLYRMLAKRGIDRVILDNRSLLAPEAREASDGAPQPATPMPTHLLASVRRPFIRYVGHRELEFNLPILAEWAVLIAQWIDEGRTPYVFVHTTDDIYAPHIGRNLHYLISEQTDVGEMPSWPGERDRQLSLF